jgi:hypothetical protein
MATTHQQLYLHNSNIRTTAAANHNNKRQPSTERTCLKSKSANLNARFRKQTRALQVTHE